MTTPAPCPVCGLAVTTTVSHRRCSQDDPGSGPWRVVSADMTSSQHPTYAGALRRFQRAFLVVLEGVRLQVLDADDRVVLETVAPDRDVRQRGRDLVLGIAR